MMKNFLLNWLGFSLVLGLAIFLRFYQLNDLPPGADHDAVINGADAWRLLNRGGHTPFLETNGGRETLSIYLQIPSVGLFGTTPLAVRLPGIISDIWLVAMLFWFAYWLRPDLPLSARRWLALWTGLAGAGSYWFVIYSRLGYRAVWTPALTLATFWLFLHAWRCRNLAWHWVWFILTGCLLGITAYTYSAARSLLIIIGLTLLPDLLPTKRNRHSLPQSLWLVHWRNLSLLGGAALLTYMPIINYMIDHPNQLTKRAFSVAVWDHTETFFGLGQILVENILATVGFFCCQGNMHLIMYGLPGRTALDPGLGLILGLGFIRSLYQSKKMSQRLLWIWFFIGLLPGFLTIESPHLLRIIVAGPAAMLLLGQGMMTIQSYLSRLTSFEYMPHIAHHLPHLVPPIFTLWLLFNSVLTFRDYHLRWPALAETKAQFKYEMRYLADHLQARTARGEVIYIPQSLYAEPTLRYYLLDPFPIQTINLQTGFQETSAKIHLLYHSDDKDAASYPATWVRLADGSATLLPAFSPQTMAQLTPSFAEQTLLGDQLRWVEPTLYLNQAIGPTTLIAASFPRNISLESDCRLLITLFWQATTLPAEAYPVLVQLVDDARQVWSLDEAHQAANGAYPTTYWRPALDLVPDAHHLQVKCDLPVGRYHLAVALYDPVQQARLPLAQLAQAQASSDTAFIGPLKVPLQASLDESLTRLDPPAEFTNLARLQAYHLSATQIKAGQEISLILWWEATYLGQTDYTVFVHLIDQAGTLVTGHDSQPRLGAYPTSIWDAGEIISDPHPIQTDSLEPGRYHLAVGLYNFQTGERVNVPENEHNRVIIEEIEVKY